MHYSKFKAGEAKGTYVLEGPATADEILVMANQLASAKPADGKA